MDLSFIRRHRAVVPDWSALLARTAAAQGATPTARAQFRLDARDDAPQLADPHVALFADALGGYADGVAAFAVLPDAPFRPRQSN